MKQLLRTAVLALAIFMFGTQSAAAQIDTFLLVPGIPGDSTFVGHENWIYLYSLTQSFDGSVARACTVAVTKGLDRSGPPLWAAAVTGQTFAEITIELVKAGGKLLRFYELKLSNARVTTISSSPGTFTEQLTIAGTTAKLTFWPQKADGTLDTPVSASVDCTASAANPASPSAPVRRPQ